MGSQHGIVIVISVNRDDWINLSGEHDPQGMSDERRKQYIKDMPGLALAYDGMRVPLSRNTSVL